jgi:predicted transcriptional regulator
MANDNREAVNGRSNDNRDDRRRPTVEKFRDLEVRVRDAGVAVETVCGMAGVSSKTWRRWRTGESEPRPSTLRKLRRSFDRVLAETIDPRR